jgi:predicted amidohydrolase
MALKIAVVQQNTIPGAVEANRAKATSFARGALAGGADVVLFHEELLVGYHERLRELAEEVDGPSTREFQALVAGTDSLIIYGLTEREGDRYYVSAPVVSAGGIIANYRKTHLWWHSEGLRHEPTYYTPGERLVTFDFKGARCGIIICYDGDFPEMTRSYANRGCQVIFWLNNREARGHDEVRPLAVANSMIIAASCCVGPSETGEHCPGGSNITDFDGRLITEIRDREGIIMAEVRPEDVAAHRAKNPWYTGRRPELYV